MKTAYMGFLTTGAALPKGNEAKAEMRPRSAKMDQFLSKVNGSPRFDAANVAAQVSQALAKSKKAA